MGYKEGMMSRAYFYSHFLHPFVDYHIAFELAFDVLSGLGLLPMPEKFHFTELDELSFQFLYV
jgi:hypothetical protein